MAAEYEKTTGQRRVEVRIAVKHFLRGVKVGGNAEKAQKLARKWYDCTGEKLPNANWFD